MIDHRATSPNIKRTPPYYLPQTLGIGLRLVLGGVRFFMSEVPLHRGVRVQIVQTQPTVFNLPYHAFQNGGVRKFSRFRFLNVT
jgi:hypothetical protein